MDLIKFFQSGGFFMYPILLVMTLGIAIAVERFIYLSMTQRATGSPLEAFITHVKSPAMWSALTKRWKIKNATGPRI